jgi:hypothetical protein
MDINLYELVNCLNQWSYRQQIALLPEGISGEEKICRRDFVETCNKKCFIHILNEILKDCQSHKKIVVSADFQIINEPTIVFAVSEIE